MSSTLTVQATKSSFEYEYSNEEKQHIVIEFARHNDYNQIRYIALLGLFEMNGRTKESGEEAFASLPEGCQKEMEEFCKEWGVTSVVFSEDK